MKRLIAALILGVIGFGAWFAWSHRGPAPDHPISVSLTGDWTANGGLNMLKVSQEKDRVTMLSTYTPHGEGPHYKYTGTLAGRKLTCTWERLTDGGGPKKTGITYKGAANTPGATG